MKLNKTGDDSYWYLTDDVQSHQVFDFLLQKVKRADKLIIGSFAVTEAYVRRIIRNRHRVDHVELILDFTIASRNPRIMLFAETNADALYLTNNHSKFIYVRGPEKSYVAIMSNNATNNHRFESGVILSDPAFISDFLLGIDKMKQQCHKQK
ncbi:hypothetical protein [Mangrovibacterium sp.]|uniref:hypothetical protein n=1 Tax=Mangrovibacterium sp. TaxID=1961364 RepID=UPI003563CD71